VAGSYVVLDLIRREFFKDPCPLWALHMRKRKGENEGGASHYLSRDPEFLVGMHAFRSAS